MRDILIKSWDQLQTAVFEDAPYAARTAKKAGFIVYVIEDKSFVNRKDELLTLADTYITGFRELL